jgi:hypothetical protein
MTIETPAALGMLRVMIISHEHRYVYIEVPRTGSTSVAKELREQYGGHLVLRKHATYRDFLRQASADERGYFSFSGIRNPLDVAVTRYAHLRANPMGHFTDPTEIAKRNSIASRVERRIYAWVHETDADFERFLRRWYLLPYDTWTSLDHKRVDIVLRFESLADDFAEALTRIGIHPVRRLPVVNATPGRDRDFARYYTPRAIRRAAWVFGPYMEEWGYAFPASWGTVKVPRWSKVLLRVARVFRAVYWKYFRFADYVKKRPGGVLAIPRH